MYYRSSYIYYIMYNLNILLKQQAAVHADDADIDFSELSNIISRLALSK